MLEISPIEPKQETFKKNWKFLRCDSINRFTYQNVLIYIHYYRFLKSSSEFSTLKLILRKISRKKKRNSTKQVCSKILQIPSLKISKIQKNPKQQKKKKTVRRAHLHEKENISEEKAKRIFNSVHHKRIKPTKNDALMLRRCWTHSEKWCVCYSWIYITFTVRQQRHRERTTHKDFHHIAPSSS